MGRMWLELPNHLRPFPRLGSKEAHHVDICHLASADKRLLANRVGPELVERYGVMPYYSVASIKDAARKLGFPEAWDGWALSLYASPSDFAAYHAQTGEDCDYAAMHAAMLDATAEEAERAGVVQQTVADGGNERLPHGLVAIGGADVGHAVVAHPGAKGVEAGSAGHAPEPRKSFDERWGMVNRAFFILTVVYCLVAWATGHFVGPRDVPPPHDVGVVVFLTCASFFARGMYSGRVRVRGKDCHRKDDPLNYWIMMGFIGLYGVLFLLFSLFGHRA
jgi:hypothetical protein